MERLLARQCYRWGVQCGKSTCRSKANLQNTKSFTCITENRTVHGIAVCRGHVKGHGCVKGQVSHTITGQGQMRWPMKNISCTAISLSTTMNNESESNPHIDNTTQKTGEILPNSNLSVRKTNCNISHAKSDFKDISDEHLLRESVTGDAIEGHQKTTLQRIIDLSKGDNLDLVHQRELTPVDNLPPKRVVKPVYNFAAVVNRSETLTNFVKLGVDLSAIEKDRDATDSLVRLDFEKDVKPVILFLHDIGVAGEDLGEMITKYPSIFKLSIEEMRTQVDYFRSKNFSAQSIARIVTKAPAIFEWSVIDIDTQLGGYQTDLKLTGNELRDVVTRLPKLLTWKVERVKEVKFYMQEFLGFSVSEIKDIFISHPKVLLSGKHQLGKRFDYLYNEMKITHNALVAFPRVFRTRVPITKQRHMFLKHVGRDQYDPKKENYVSLKALVTYKDRDFAFHLAKTSVSQFNDFLKTI